MATDIWAILDDYSSTPECWNMTNVLKINKAGGLSHDAIRPMFITLTNVEFLNRCKEGIIQNANASFNALVWSLPAKEKYHGPLKHHWQ